MKIYGSIRANLAAALSSARRLRGHPVHSDTLRYWNDLLHHARRELSRGEPSARREAQALQQLIGELETELADRSSVSEQRRL